jgi:phage terminase large subunit-like protein
MNRRTFLSLPLLGFFSTVTEPVYGGMDLAGLMNDTSVAVVHRDEYVAYWVREWHGGEVIELNKETK